MASIINGSINLSKIPKDKIITGKKGKYLPVTIVINDEPDQFGNQGPITVAQTKEERESKVAKTYLGNINVLWTNGNNVEPNKKENNQWTKHFHFQPKELTIGNKHLRLTLAIFRRQYMCKKNIKKIFPCSHMIIIG